MGLFDDVPQRRKPLDQLRDDLEKAHGLTPGLLASMAAAESGGNLRATSPKGAAGLMQFMPATAAQYGIDPRDDYQATDGAARYLADLKRQFDGDELKAVAAYNAGAGAVARHGGVPPWQETVGYVLKVLEPLVGNAQAADAPAAGLFDDVPPVATPSTSKAGGGLFDDVPPVATPAPAAAPAPAPTSPAAGGGLFDDVPPAPAPAPELSLDIPAARQQVLPADALGNPAVPLPAATPTAEQRLGALLGPTLPQAEVPTLAPWAALEGLAAGRALRPAEFQGILSGLETGAFAEPDQVRKRLALALPDEAMKAVDAAALAGQMLRGRGPMGAGEVAGRRAVGAASLGLAGPGALGDDPLSQASARADDLAARAGQEAHPLAALAGDFAGQVLPYAAATALLREARMAAALAPIGGDAEAYRAGVAAIERQFLAPGSAMTSAQRDAAIQRLGHDMAGGAGYLQEGLALDVGQGLAQRPEGADRMSAADELKARAGQAALNAPLGLVLGAGGMALGEAAKLLGNRQVLVKLERDAKDAGFDDVDAYMASLVDVIQTADGPVIRPKASALRDFPGEAPTADSLATAASPAADGPALALALPRPGELSAMDGAAAASPAPPDWRGLMAEADERERLGRATESAAIRQQLFGEALALRRQAEGLRDGGAPKMTPADRAAQIKIVDPQKDTLATAIRKLGGIDVGWETDWAGRLSHLRRQSWGLPPIERKTGGRTLDDLAESLHDLGYLETRDKRELEQLLGLAETGRDLFSNRKTDYSAEVAPKGEAPPAPATAASDADVTHHALGDVWDVTPDGIIPVRNASPLGHEFSIVGPAGELRPSRPVTLEELENLLEEERNAEEWFAREKASFAGQEEPGPAATTLRQSPAAGFDGNATGASEAARSYQQPGGFLGDGESGAEIRQGNPFEGWADYQPSYAETGILNAGRGRYRGSALPDPAAGAGVDAGRAGGVGNVPGRQVAYRASGAALPTGLHTARTPAEVAHVSAGLRKQAQENLLAIAIDAEGNIVRVAQVAKGGRESINLDGLGEMAGAAMAPKASGVWLVHNHPPGDVLQSDMDAALQRQFHQYMQGTGVEPLGMVVVGAKSGQYSVYKPVRADGSSADGGTALPIPAQPRRSSLPILERMMVGRMGDAPPVDSPVKLRAALADNGPGVLLLDGRLRPAGFVPLTGEDLLTLRQGAGGPSAKLLSALDASNASHLAVRLDDATPPEAVARNVGAFAAQGGFKLLDVVGGDGRSLVNEGRMPNEAELSRAQFYSNPLHLGALMLARDIGLHPGRNAAAGFAGGTFEALDPDNKEQPGSARWWMRVAMGAFGGVAGSNVARQLGIVGAGGFTMNALNRLGRAIDHLPFVGRGPAELRDMKRRQDLMRQLLDRQTAAVGLFMLKHFTPSERAQIADLIESRGVVADLNLVHRQAAELDSYIAGAAEQLKTLGMLPDDLATGGYLHRFYEKDLDVARLLGHPFKQSISGTYTLARGTDERFQREYFSPAAQAHVAKYEQVRGELAAMEARARRSGIDDLFTEDYQALKARRKALEGVEFAEYIGGENGKPQVYFFMPDEVARVPAAMDGAAGQAFEFRPGPGLDARVFPVADVGALAPTARRWSLRGTDEGGALLHRDWTKAEREAMGEIEDAGYRYVRGMAEVSHDLSLATLFNRVSRRADWVSDTARDGFVEVPAAGVGGSPLRKYGALAGKFVRADIWAGLRNHGRSPLGQSNLARIYRQAVGQWKLWHTADNPVSHFNNTFSNTEMLGLAGYGPGDIVQSLRHMRQGEASAMWREARDEGLFGTDWTSSILAGEGGNAGLMDLAEMLRTQPEIPAAAVIVPWIMGLKKAFIDSKAAIAGAEGKYATGLEVVNAMAKPVLAVGRAIGKPYGAYARVMRRAYQFEDNLFKLAVYQAERGKGASPREAVNRANTFFFDYADVPEAVRWLRDLPIGAPFISYTYLAMPALVKNAIERPETMLALVAGYEALNYAALQATSDGVRPGEYWALARDEETNSPGWERGRALTGARNMVHVPFPEGYRLALGRAHAGGNPFAGEGGGREKLPQMPVIGEAWGSSIFGGSPLHSLLDISINEDWKGKKIYHEKDPTAERVRKSLAYLYQSWAPSSPVVPGSYHQQKIMEGLANQAAEARKAGQTGGLVPGLVDAANGVAEALGMGQFTGLDRAENPILTRDALLGSMGVKLRPQRPGQSLDHDLQFLKAERREIASRLRKEEREFDQKRITPAKMKEAQAIFDRHSAEVDAREDALYEAYDRLKKAGVGQD